ncbi:MAG: RNase adapter RapZ [Gammaproteobacteria bacterium]|jgi:RNase adapter protein RapZ|nr:RNase adapter RapZ [Gammaproteobacteria bacterium]MBT5600627.1 RNase adapter RapZ [Gammaproteobacteria bacterium]MBT6245115.1 RNase adapter RapZ [Gammaproteobacteria bacterium]
MASFIIISGRSGSGKSTALHILEDLDYYCIDNLPASLIPDLVGKAEGQRKTTNIAVSIDARNIATDLQEFPSKLDQLRAKGITPKVIYLDSASPTLVKRFSETRRKHPLTSSETGLREALELESELLDGISEIAALKIDTTNMTIHELRDTISSRVAFSDHAFEMGFQSFAFKGGVPIDADFVFDVRCLPNPHWIPHLRALTGMDEEIIAFLDQQSDVVKMTEDIQNFVGNWLPSLEASNRSYLTIAIGCTGGQHRSVYIAEKLYGYFRTNKKQVRVRHRELKPEKTMTNDTHAQ